LVLKQEEMTKKNKKVITNNNTGKTGNKTSAAESESMKNNYCSLVNNDFDAAMKALFEEQPDQQEIKPKNNKKTQ
jgi:hypothetical protein